MQWVRLDDWPTVQLENDRGHQYKLDLATQIGNTKLPRLADYIKIKI